MTNQQKINDIIELLEMAVETFDDEYAGTLANGYTCSECLVDVKEILINSVSSDSLEIPITSEDKLERLNLITIFVSHAEDAELQTFEIMIELKKQLELVGLSPEQFQMRCALMIKQAYSNVKGEPK